MFNQYDQYLQFVLLLQLQIILIALNQQRIGLNGFGFHGKPFYYQLPPNQPKPHMLEYYITAYLFQLNGNNFGIPRTSIV